MFITIISQDRPAVLDYPIDNSSGNLQVALHEIVCKVKWFNISEALGNNWVQYKGEYIFGDNEVTIDDGYYGLRDLNKIFRDSGTGINLKINENSEVTMTFKADEKHKTHTISEPLAKMLGIETIGDFTFISSKNNRTYEGDHPINPRLFVHLDELNTNQNLYDGQPSTALRIIPNRKFVNMALKHFTKLQFKPLARGHYEKLNLRITDQKGKHVRCDDLHVVLEIK